MTAGTITRIWYVLMVAGGLVFGSLANWRPLGTGLLEHPIVIYFALVAVGLLTLRFALSRPVPEVISDRALFAGGVAGVAAFLLANFAVVFVFR